MEVTETLSEGLKREFKIVIGADSIESSVDAKLKDMAGQVRLPGFRPGKAPLPILRQRFRKAVLPEVLDERIRESVESTMGDRGLRPAVEPRVDVESFEDGTDLEISVSTEILPEIEPGDIASIEIERLRADADDDAVNEAIERVAEQSRTMRDVEEPRPAQSGDVAVIDFVGRVDGEEFPGGAAEDYELDLGSNTFIPGFEDQVIGASPGETRDVTVSFPEDYGAEHLAGKEAVFEVTVKSLKEREPATIDEALAERLGFDSLDALRGAVRERIEQEYEQIARARLKRDLFDKLDEMHDFAVPEALIDQEFQGIWGQVQQQLQGPNAEEVREGKSDEDLEEEYRRVAKRRVKLGLLLSEIGRRNGITVGQDELARAMRQQAAQFPGQENLVYDYYQKNPGAFAQLQAPILEEKVVDFIVELAKVETRTVPVEELNADAEEEGDGNDAESPQT